MIDPVDPLFFNVFNELAEPRIIVKADAPRFTVVTHNKMHQKVSNTSGKDIRGISIWEVFDPAQGGSNGYDLVLGGLEKAIATKKIVNLEPFRYDIPSVDGLRTEEHWWALELLPLPDAGGNIQHVMGTTHEVTNKIKAKQNNLDQQEKFHTLIEQAAMAIIVFRGDDLVIDSVNPLMLELLGKSGDILDKPLLMAVPELKGQPPYELLHKVYITGETFKGHETPVTLFRNGRQETGYFNFTYSPLIEDGKITGIIDMAVEVTAQVRANEKLSALNAELLEARQASESERETLNQFLLQAPVGVCVLNGPKLVYQFINPGYQALLPGRDLQDRPVFEALPELVGTPIQQMLLDVYHKGETFHLNELLLPIAKEEGGTLLDRYFTFIYTPWRNKAGLINGILVFAHEVTEQVSVHKKIEKAEANLRLATEAADLATWYINAETFEFFPSPRLVELFGYDPHETMPYEAAVSQIADSHRDKVIEAVNAAVNSGESYNLEYPVIGFNDQQVRWVRAIGKLFEATAGEPAHFSGTIVEITKEKEQEQLKNDFISMVSHELKTPLTSLKGYLQMLSMKARKSEDEFALNTLSRAGKQIEKMTKMINGFLNVARLEAGSIYIDPQVFDMAILVKESEAESSASVTSHRIIYAPVEETIVKADMDKIGQVIHNLISNAVKYSTPGSTIRVACETIDDHARICVQDGGMGIKPKDIKRLFERFYRVENTETKAIGGFGIGLYLCAEIVRRHDGKIWVESEPGQGSTFFFSIPTYVNED